MLRSAFTAGVLLTAGTAQADLAAHRTHCAEAYRSVMQEAANAEALFWVALNDGRISWEEWRRIRHAPVQQTSRHLEAIRAASHAGDSNLCESLLDDAITTVLKVMDPYLELFYAE